MVAIQVYLLSLIAALYLFRAMLEFGQLGWGVPVILNVVVGVVILPVVAAIASMQTSWGSLLVIAVCVVAFLVNGAFLVRLWQGPSPAALTTIAIMLAYLLLFGVALSARSAA